MIDKIICPRPLSPGDRVAIVSPAGIINPDYVNGMVAVLAEWGYQPVVMHHALGQNGRYSGTVNERLDDILVALRDESVRAIFCSRGGYGCVHLLDTLSRYDLRTDPKWLIGFSDVSALHALWSSQGIASIHGPQARHLSLNQGKDPDSTALREILSGDDIEYNWETEFPIQPLSISGQVYGGNLSVLQALIGTPCDIFQKSGIFFLEDINEPVYKIDRMVTQLKLAGVFSRCQALILGDFTGTDNPAVFQVIKSIVKPTGMPVITNAPIGHGERNMPLMEGSMCQIASEGNRVRMTFAG